MNLIRRLGAVLAGALLAIAGVAPAALARPFPPRPPGWDKHPPPGASIRIVVAAACPAGRSPSSRPGSRCWPPCWR